MENTRDFYHRLARETKQEMAQHRRQLHSQTPPAEKDRLLGLLAFGQQCLDEYGERLARIKPNSE